MRGCSRALIFSAVAPFLWLLIPLNASAQQVAGLGTRYLKTEHKIPMRDGTQLFTVVYQPRDRTRTYPILIERTPYGVGPYGPRQLRTALGPSPRFSDSGYIFVFQDVRGCFMSDGTFEDIRPMRKDRADPKAFDESTDAFDTVAWLLKNIPNHNAKVGLWGISYPGFYAAASLVDAHPAIKAVSPQAPVIDWFLGDDSHHNGALFLHQEFNFDAVFGIERRRPSTHHGAQFDHGTDNAYEFFLRLGPLPRANELYFKGKRRFWNEVMEHGNYDSFWKDRAIASHLKSVKPAVMTVGGWFDAQNLYGALHCYQAIETGSPAETTNVLVMGPWSHGGWSQDVDETLASVNFGPNVNRFYQDEIEFPFFEDHLKGDGKGKLPEAWVFETGRNAWRSLKQWPPRNVARTSLMLGSNGRLGFQEKRSEPTRFDTFISDPAHPVPYTNTVSIQCPESYMVEDQSFAAQRSDVLVYQTEPLKEDLTIAGPIDVELFVSTTGTDADWVVKLIDVAPGKARGSGKGGVQQLVRGDVMRGKFRDSFEAPRAFTPGEPTRVPFSLQDCFHTFRAGHRLMVQVQSSWFPLVDRNPQTFVDIYQAKTTDFRKSTHQIYHEPGRASRLVLPVLR